MNFGSLTLETDRSCRMWTIAYDTYGRWRRMVANAFSSTHGYTAITTLAGRYGPADSKVGWWIVSLDPRKAIDTTAASLWSPPTCSAPARTDRFQEPQPATGKALRPRFPDLTMRDIVVAQREFLIRLGVTHLVAVAGPSLGGRTAFNGRHLPRFHGWHRRRRFIPPKIGKDDAAAPPHQRLSTDPNWNDGWVIRAGRDHPHHTAIRMGTLKRYRIEAVNRYRPPQSWAARSAHSATG